MQDWNSDRERRRHFRIHENASVRYQLRSDPQQPLEVHFSDDQHFTLSTALRDIEEEAEPLLRQLHAEDKTLTAYLRLQSRKMELIAQALSQQTGESFTNPISLSEGGISFIAQDDYPAGTQLALAIKLLPSYLGLLLSAKVVYSLKVSEQAYRLGCAFDPLNEQQLNHIRRHTLESQARERRQQQEAKVD